MSKHLVQLEIIYNRINEFFFKNPEARSAVFEVNFGDDKGNLRVVREGAKLRIHEGPAGKVLKQKETAAADHFAAQQADIDAQKSQLAQQVAAIQQAQQPGSQLPPPPPPPDPAAPPPGAPQPGPLMPGRAANLGLPPSVPNMPPPIAAPAPVPPPVAAPAPVPPPAPAPATGLPPPPAMPGGEGLPPPPEPLAKDPLAPGGDPGSIQLPPGAQDGDINSSQAADVVRDLFAQQPGAMQRQFGSVNTGNPNVPADMAAGTEPPEKEEEGVVQDATITPSVNTATMQDVERDFGQAVDTSQVPQAMATATQALQNLQGPDHDKVVQYIQDLGALQDDPLGHTSLYANKRQKGKVLKEQNPVLQRKALDDAVPFEPTTSEESALLRGLKGKTVQDVSVENDEDSVRISLSLATTEWPVVFTFERGGKVTYTFKDRRYVLMKSWA